MEGEEWGGGGERERNTGSDFGEDFTENIVLSLLRPNRSELLQERIDFSKGHCALGNWAPIFHIKLFLIILCYNV
jgi:hypothetical protein